MSENQPLWVHWARILQQWGINQGIASLLDIAGSLSVLLAQFLYLSQPLLFGVVSSVSLNSLAEMLEDAEERNRFIIVLREGSFHEPIA